MLEDRPLLLLDEQLPDVQPSDLKLLYVQALDPATLHSECPDRQGAYRHRSRRARTHRHNLEGVRGVTNEQLEQQAKSLEGATMPNGQKYDDWAQESRRGR